MSTVWFASDHHFVSKKVKSRKLWPWFLRGSASQRVHVIFGLMEPYPAVGFWVLGWCAAVREDNFCPALAPAPSSRLDWLVANQVL
jgi:hypothetical protein